MTTSHPLIPFTGLTQTKSPRLPSAHLSWPNGHGQSFGVPTQERVSGQR
jgi:hypothetical protein